MPYRMTPRGLALRLTLGTLLATACQAAPLPHPPDDPHGEHPHGSAPPVRAPGFPRATPGSVKVVDEGPGRVRPPWNGSRKTPISTQVLSYPTTYQGPLTVRDLAMVESTLYTIDRTLQAVPVSGGQWAPVSVAGLSAPTRLASDGQRLFAGTSGGQVMGLDPANGQSATLATLPSAVTGLQVGQNVLWVGTERDGVYRVPVNGGTPEALVTNESAARRVQDLTLGNQVVFTMGDRLWAWPMDGAPARPVPGSEGATALTSHRGVLYAGTADGWLLRSRDQGVTTQALGQMVDTPLETLGTDGAWLYSSSGNTAYMLDLKRYTYSLCHAGFPAAVTNLTVKDGATVLVGTRTRGLTTMPR